MQTFVTIAQIRAAVAEWRAAGERVAFVPTMGYLHAGHISLVQEAHRHAQRVVASIFVNPLQFGANEDLGRYPRDLECDTAKLRTAQTHALFTPDAEEMYPRGTQDVTRVEVPGISDVLCGAARPGHFAGVATVVVKLLNIVQPDVALFGEKDYQQLLVIRRMVEDLCLPVQVIGVPTLREEDGLAMSSRNVYLSAAERKQAPLLHSKLRAVAHHIQAGERDYAKLEREAQSGLAAAGFRPDYVTVRRALDLAPPQPGDVHLVVLAAAWLGSARLIDNLALSLKDNA